MLGSRTPHSWASRIGVAAPPVPRWCHIMVPSGANTRVRKSKVLSIVNSKRIRTICNMISKWETITVLWLYISVCSVCPPQYKFVTHVLSCLTKPDLKMSHVSACAVKNGDKEIQSSNLPNKPIQSCMIWIWFPHVSTIEWQLKMYQRVTTSWHWRSHFILWIRSSKWNWLLNTWNRII